MASPIPTQLSPGVNVSEIDLSLFVQPESQSSGGMVGAFNWGPSLVATRVTSESELASVFGKPTLDPSDTLSESDFFSAANFLRYSNNLKVIRLAQGSDTNATTTDAGITAISSCTYPVIKNEEEFEGFGGMSGYDGIEPVAHFRARYPGNFGDSLKVIVWDGATGQDTATTTSAAYLDYALAGGYATSNIVGITSGNIGYTFSAYTEGSQFGGADFDLFGTTSGTHQYFVVSFFPANNQNVSEFINELGRSTTARSKLNFIYATGTTSANATLSASDPSGNRANYYILEDANIVSQAFTPFLLGTPGVAASIFAKASTTNSGAVDILFLNADLTNMHPTWVLNDADINPIVKFDNFQASGIPSNFGSLIYNNQTNFLAYRDQISKVSQNIFNSATGTPTTTLKGWALLVGLTGGVTFKKTTNGVAGTIGVTFDAVGGVTGIMRDWAFGMKQFGYSGTVTNSEGREEYSNVRIFDKTPNTSEFAENNGGSNDELSFALIDTQGKFGPKNAILERFELLSKAIDVKNLDGESIYYKDYINNNSSYVYLTKTFGLSGGGAASSPSTTTFGDILQSYVVGGTTYIRKGYYESQMNYGQSGITGASGSDYAEAYSLFADDDYAVDILFVPESSVANDSISSVTTVENIAYDTVIAPRKDTILVLPTPRPTSITQHSAETTSRTINFRKNVLGVPSNSYTILVAGRKLFFDTFNNQIRKMSLSSDVAGILSAQEIPWESPAGFARGMLKNAIRLETNFTKADRDELYKNNINFFLQFSDGSGTALFGDKTMLTKPSAFDRVNVRRVFIALEKSIAKAAKYSLFEFNDEFTRSQFRNLVIPFLRSIQSQRGIVDFKVVCDTTNNTPEVIDRNQFVADIYIKPNKSINFIQLNFIAIRSDANFTTTE